MSFRTFIYYCALGGGWAAFLVWALVLLTGVRSLNAFLATPIIGGILGVFLAGTVGGLDARLNAVGSARLLRVMVCMGVGFFGGLFSGLAGEIFNYIVYAISGSSLPFARVPGWILVGICIGLSIGFYDLLVGITGGAGTRQAVRKMFNGFLGGFLGGLIGGILFESMNLVGGLVGRWWTGSSSSNLVLRTPLALGLVILGICIGALVGLAQVILKEAWLKVEAGFRPGRELMLTKNEFVIGRAEGCDLGLFGDKDVEKKHALIVLDNNRYLLEDVGTPGGTYLNDEQITGRTQLRDGDLIRIGKSQLRFGERHKRPGSRR